MNEQINNLEFPEMTQDVRTEIIIDDIQEEIKELIGEFGQDEKFNITLYKIDGITGRGKQIAKFRDGVFPDSHEIGVLHGSGEYQIYINYSDPNTKTGKGLKKKRFSLGENYDQLKRDNDAKKLNEFLLQKENHLANNKQNSNMDSLIPFLQMQQQQSNTMLQTMMQMQQQSSQNFMSLAGILAPLLFKDKDSGFEKLLPVLIEKISDNNKENIGLVKEIYSMKSNDQEVSPIENIVTKLIENADKILSPLASTKRVRSELQKSPQLLEIINHKERFEQVKAELVEKLGEEKTEKILNKAGINQGEQPQETGQQTSVIDL